MTMINTSKPSSPTFANSTRVSTGVNWDIWTVAWQNEIRTWNELASVMDNTSKQSSSMTNTAKP